MSLDVEAQMSKENLILLRQQGVLIDSVGSSGNNSGSVMHSPESDSLDVISSSTAKLTLGVPIKQHDFQAAFDLIERKVMD